MSWRELAASEGGKPLVDSTVEVTRAINGVLLCVEALRGNAGSVVPLGTSEGSAGRRAFTQKRTAWGRGRRERF